MLRNDGLSYLCYLQTIGQQQLNKRSTSCFENAEIEAVGGRGCETQKRLKRRIP